MSGNSLKSKRIGVLLGGQSAERAVSLETGEAVLNALKERGFSSVVAIDVDRDICARVREDAVELAFIALHGGQGEDGCLQGLLEILDIPYTGSGVLASAMAMDKVVSKRLFTVAGLPTPAWAYPAAASVVEPPLVIKPRTEGSSVGVQMVDDAETLAQLIADNQGEGLIAEKYVPGRELSVAVFGHGSAARCLGTIEVRVAEGFYDYAAKYERDDTEYVVAPELPQQVAQRMCEHAVAAHRLLECGGATRIDFRWDGESEPTLLEVNTLPGLTSHSLVPKIAAHVGISYGELVERIVEEAVAS